jgi:hypothetical protein
MSIEAMKQVIELYDKHCYNNDHGGIEFNKKHGYKFIEAIESLRAAIQQAEVSKNEPVAWMHWLHGPVQVLMNKDEAMMELERLNREYPSGANDRKMRPLVFGDTHPAPGVPDGYVLVPVEPTQEMLNVQTWDFNRFYSPREIWTAMLAAAQAQKGQP